MGPKATLQVQLGWKWGVAVRKSWWYPKTNLHRAGKRPDWELISPHHRNLWQKLAAATGGLITPSNAVSIAGIVLVGYGLLDILNGKLLTGLLWIAAGRLADIADGLLAQKTGTKSPLGEALDVSIDKITVVGALLVFVAASILPLSAAIVVAGRNGAIIALGLLARTHRQVIHPGRAGKYAAAGEWLCLGLFVVAALFAKQNLRAAEIILLVLAYLALAISLVLGLIALRAYSRLASNKRG